MKTRRVETLVSTGLCRVSAAHKSVSGFLADSPSPLRIALHNETLDDRGSHKGSGREQEVAEQNYRVVKMELVCVTKDERSCNTKNDGDNQIGQLVFRLTAATTFANHHSDPIGERPTNDEDENRRDYARQIAQTSQLERNSGMAKLSASLSEEGHSSRTSYPAARRAKEVAWPVTPIVIPNKVCKRVAQTMAGNAMVLKVAIS